MPQAAMAQEKGREARVHADSRKATILRTAKVICQTGEYLCLVRELSEIGLSLKFLHPVPKERRILLQLTNGLTYPIERVWVGRQQAGYRFGNGIDLKEFLSEAAPYECRPIRLSLSTPGTVTDGRIVTKVSLTDLSREGAQFESERHHTIGALIGFEAPGLPQRLAEVRWQNGALYGMRFQQPLTLQQLADVAISLQPMTMREPDLTTAALKRSRAA